MRIHIGVEADVARAAMVAARMGAEAGFGDVERCMVSTAVSELARNILKYAGRGEVTIRRLAETRTGIEVVADDEGPGIPDVDRALEDHFSTGGTLGLGLPGVRRMMDEFVVNTGTGAGTRITIRKWR